MQLARAVGPIAPPGDTMEMIVACPLSCTLNFSSKMKWHKKKGKGLREHYPGTPWLERLERMKIPYYLN